MNAIIPIPKCEITIRPATLDDLPFIDALQKQHTKMVGWMPTAQLEGKIKLGHVLIAEEPSPLPSPLPSPSVLGEGVRVGYVIGNDQYFKRDDLGIIYQMNVVPGKRRGLIGATLLKAMFDRSAYGCRLFCCWCAQDIEANRFWEACGFVPLAFRTGSRSKGKNGTPRVHIFWQKRIREGDTTTPWWFPSQTSSGAVREDRLVLPIPPGTHWSDAKPVVLPGAEKQLDQAPTKRLVDKKPHGRDAHVTVKPRVTIGFGFLSFTPPAPVKEEKPKREKTPKVKQKNDPKYVAAARELRDRWLERVNDDPSLLMPAGKYQVQRSIGGSIEGSIGGSIGGSIEGRIGGMIEGMVGGMIEGTCGKDQQKARPQLPIAA